MRFICYSSMLMWETKEIICGGTSMGLERVPAPFQVPILMGGGSVIGTAIQPLRVQIRISVHVPRSSI
jgi:hypothetical protein